MKFGIGQPVRRTEDLRLITGQGLYTDDIVLPRTAQAFVLRSPVAHANIKRIDTAAARGTPGVLWVATGEDLAELATCRAWCRCKIAMVHRGTTRRGRCWRAARCAMSASP